MSGGSNPTPYSRVILDHYSQEAKAFGVDATSTMRDEVTRATEITAVLDSLQWLDRCKLPSADVLDIGCGNGYLLDLLRDRRATAQLTGLEYTPEMVALARERKIDRCNVVQGDVRELPFETDSFDVAITERCIINVMDVEDQARSLLEVARVLRPGGHFICIEAFSDSLDRLNEGRREVGLDPILMPHHNIWFDTKWFFETVSEAFEVLEPPADSGLPAADFLSSHYFMSRLVYPLVTKADVTYNTHFVKFFANLTSQLPPIGSYGPIRFYLLRKKA